jgi:hypothetical protein
MTGDLLAPEPLCVYEPHSSPLAPPAAVAHPSAVLEK